MEMFIQELRRGSNHLGDEDHSKLHLVIREVAKSVFGEDKDEHVVDWLNTEDMHAEMKGENPVYVKDFRCDTDRTMFGVLTYLLKKPEYKERLQTFWASVKPALEKFELVPDYSVDSLDSMPWDAGHILHMVLSRQLQQLSFKLFKEKVVKREVLMKYLEDCRSMEYDYYNFGLDPLQKSMLKCNKDLQDIHTSLATYLARARVKTSDRYSLAGDLKKHIEMLILSM